MARFEGAFPPSAVFSGGSSRAPLSTPDGEAIEDSKDLLAPAGLL